MVLGSLINHPERLNRDTLYELRGIVARYPYFQAARLLLLNNLYLLHESDFGTELRRSVLYISDRVALCRLVEGFMDRVEPEEAVEQGRLVRKVTAGQSMGQKNTVFAIWLAYTFMTPETAIVGGLYSIWHNIYNSWQLRNVAKKKS